MAFASTQYEVGHRPAPGEQVVRCRHCGAPATSWSQRAARRELRIAERALRHANGEEWRLDAAALCGGVAVVALVLGLLFVVWGRWVNPEQALFRLGVRSGYASIVLCGLWAWLRLAKKEA